MKKLNLLKVLRKNINLIIISLIIYILGVPFGFLYHRESKEFLIPILDKIKESFTLDSRFEIAINIFLNNLESTLILFVSGTLIIVPFIILFINGFVMGFVFRLFIQERDLILFFSALLPHSIFELTAIFISSALGIRIGITYLIPRGDRIKKVSIAIREGILVYLILVVPLLIIAAFIEAYISARLVGL
ncbi:MAG: hypothetical protein DRO90_00150 [Candidatus Altiarchaeales archaeon]|nr:MAG: hypothetical protein DRO94_00915 [Candidatus Altiarchaeales archaeon]RLI95510.1 MAG: hypothetical protein DRO90_00150 [Candidatus Altiarchaeales archaeon]HDO82239.1 stage II sporulation protein M [Candidatus Altiarchaeales archaeon]HEX54888.1 stage II sporulation protein M [Candidatus Altiarchaeales archaeon]